MIAHLSFGPARLGRDPDRSAERRPCAAKRVVRFTVPRSIRLLLALIALFAAPPALFAAPPALLAAPARAPLVLAAASLQEAMSAAADRWQAQGHPRPVIAFAASSALARQIESGQPADLFVSADIQWMDYLAGKRLIRAGTRTAFLTNALVLVAPANSRTRLTIAPGFALARALGPDGRLAMGDPGSVPAGIYGKQALTRLGVWPTIAARVAGAENVRAALALVTRGAAPLGIVYATDARAEPKVRIVGTFPASSHAPIIYPLALLASSTNPDAEGFRRFLLSPAGKQIFARFGFGVR